MNLDLSWLGWAHAAACLVALGLGPATFFQRKGSPAHVALGRTYLAVMLAVNFTSLGIYRRHMFWFPHWFAVAALVCIGLGYLAVRLKWPRGLWLRLHVTGMIASYYVLIGGGVNEVSATHGVVISATHTAVMAAFVALIVAMNIFAVRGGAGRRPAVAGAR